ncbi:MAG: glycosyltransferase [candidate division WOR-3 bacterium]
MKVLILGNLNSVHTVRWINALNDEGLDVYAFGLSGADNREIQIPIDKVRDAGIHECASCSTLTKIKYLSALIKLKEFIRSCDPDILHAHFASSYGLLGALSGFHPYVVSVWGADVYNFPRNSFLNREVIKFILMQSDVITSTSKVMAIETRKYTKKQIHVVPFGVDTSIFKPTNVCSIFREDEIVIGTIKALEKKYGIDVLIKAFHILKTRLGNYPLKLLIVGGGSQESELKNLVRVLGLERDVVFTGKVRHSEVARYHNMITIFAALSIDESESFGVAVVEAMACGRPVVVSRVGGLPEVVEDGVTGFVVPPMNPEAAASALQNLITNPELRKKMGLKALERVKSFYDWRSNVKMMIRIYESIYANRLNYLRS